MKQKIEKCKSIKCILTDVDGVLTDGGRYFSRTAHPSMGNYREKSPLWKATSKNRKLRTDIKHQNVWKNHYADNTRICWSHEYVG